MRETYFHEDDYCQIELIPDTNWEYCTREASKIDAFSEQHRAEIGWTDIYIRRDNPHGISELAISMDAFTAEISPVLPAFDRVLTGFGSRTIISEHTVAFGKNSRVVVFAASAVEETVSAIWLTLDTRTEWDKADALDALQVFSGWPLMLADWGWTTMIRLCDIDVLNRYLGLRVEVFSQPFD